jgi:hypothetical protein
MLKETLFFKECVKLLNKHPSHPTPGLPVVGGGETLVCLRLSPRHQSGIHRPERRKQPAVFRSQIFSRIFWTCT